MKKLFLIFFPFVFLVSCEKDTLFLWDQHTAEEYENAYVYAPSPVFDVIAPSYVKYGETISIQVRSVGNSGCAGFSNFLESKTGNNTINIRVEQKEPKEDFCTSVVTTITSVYEFVADSRQKYTFNFWRGELHENDFVSVNITVK